MQRQGWQWPRRLNLHAGDWVVVRSKEEILATLDQRGRLDNLPFQPEMFAFCGQRMQVSKVSHKTCDTIHKTGGRRMLDAVHLRGGRCDGSSHGGCQADCVFFWKEAWLRRVDDSAQAIAQNAAISEADVLRYARAEAPDDTEPVYVCQTTALYEATTLLQWWDARQYVRDVTSRNHGAWHLFKLLFAASYRNFVRHARGYRVWVAIYNAFQRFVGGRPFPVVACTVPQGQATPNETLDLLPGEWVEVKSAAEIGATLNQDGFNRGLRYDMEMLKYSGHRYRVQMRVDRLISESTGRMMEMKTPCIQLEDVYCRAECTPRRIGCPRGTNTYWRETWLRRVGADR